MHVLDGGARWRHLANTIIEPFMCGGDAVFLSSYFEHLVFIRPRRRATYTYVLRGCGLLLQTDLRGLSVSMSQ